MPVVWTRTGQTLTAAATGVLKDQKPVTEATGLREMRGDMGRWSERGLWETARGVIWIQTREVKSKYRARNDSATYNLAISSNVSWH